MNVHFKYEKNKRFGFTLAELLIALAILGVIATFSIPKILNGTQNSKNNAIVKEAASMVSGAYSEYLATHSQATNVGINDLTPYMNYVSMDTASAVDLYYTGGTRICGSNTIKCLRLHNGAVLQFDSAWSFGAASTTNAVYFDVDPDGNVTDGTTNGPGKATEFYLFYSGKISSDAQINASICSSQGCFALSQYTDPPYFHW